MRKFILIAGFVLASATAQAEPRSLSLAGSDVQAAPTPAKTVEMGKTAEAPQAETTKSDATKSDAPKVETPKAEAPKYIERPAAVETPKAEAPKVEQTNVEPAKPVKSAKADKPRHKRYWTEGRIIGELHRHGIYW
jgi:hypothetical protein